MPLPLPLPSSHTVGFWLGSSFRVGDRVGFFEIVGEAVVGVAVGLVEIVGPTVGTEVGDDVGSGSLDRHSSWSARTAHVPWQMPPVKQPESWLSRKSLLPGAPQNVDALLRKKFSDTDWVDSLSMKTTKLDTISSKHDLVIESEDPKKLNAWPCRLMRSECDKPTKELRWKMFPCQWIIGIWALPNILHFHWY